MKRLALFVLIASFALGQGQNFGNYITTNAQTGTTYTVANTDFAKLVTFSNVGAVAVTLPQAGTVGLNTGWYVYVENIGAGTVTITPTTSTIDGAATLVLTTNQGAMLVSNGTNYASVRGIGGVTVGTFSTNCVTKASSASAIVCSSITDDGTRVSTSELIQGGAGTQAAPGVTAGGTAQGLWAVDSSHIALVGNGEVRLYSDNTTGNQVGFTGTFFYPGLSGKDLGSASFQWQTAYLSNGLTLGTDTFAIRAAAANLQLGAAAAAAPVAQTISVQQPTATNSNQAAGSTTFTTQNGTGTGLATCSLIVNAPSTNTATGTTVQTSLNRLCTHDVKNLTTGAATTVLSIALPAAASTGGTVDYTIIGTDGTNTCTESGFMEFSAENSAGVFVTNITDSTGTLDSKACTATKTLTISWALSGANPALLQLTPTLTGITATRFTIAYDVHNHGDAVVTF